MAATVERWGDDLGVRISKSIAERIGVAEGTEVVLTVREGELIVVPRGTARSSLGDLVAGITRANRHDEFDTGLPAGTEVW